jgi:flagellar biosynthesis protein FlhA
LPNANNFNDSLLLPTTTDVLMGFAAMSILMVMVIPIPAMLLDLFLSFNITLSLIILLVGMYILKPLDLSSFPSLLLLSTLFRLSLNVASTRMILLNGNEGTHAAGKVIMAFGNFVVGGNYLVGFIVFVILVVINFMVITKGAGRIAEVAARFTLDAMPGKQMSIDADLNAGLIDETQARSAVGRSAARRSTTGPWMVPISLCAAMPLPALSLPWSISWPDWPSVYSKKT